jgi:hypothetical protein
MDAFLPMFAQKLLDSGESGQLAAEAIKLHRARRRAGAALLEQLAAAGALHGKTTSEQTEEAHQFIVSLREMEGSAGGAQARVHHRPAARAQQHHGRVLRQHRQRRPARARRARWSAR